MLILLLALVLAFLVRAFVVESFVIPTGSMERTLLVGDRVVTAKWPGRGPVARGDVVVFDGATTFGRTSGPPSRLDDVLKVLGGHPGAEIYVKRVIGVGGDRVACCDDRGRLTVNGVGLDEPYLYPGDAPSAQRFDVQVPRGRLWLMGDHRSASADSRAHLGSPGGGTVAESDVIGSVLFRYWPWDSRSD